ncbi:MAG: non-hydrolyzing UDP-N-acetylglucosamine 2-epimerase [Candidatus Rifleibacteriota bacterium]
MPRFLFILGTRPEIIKLAPVIIESHKRGIETTVVHTGQHLELARDMLEHFDITPDINLEVMQPNQSLFSLSAKIIAGLEPILKARDHQMVFVQGDTSTVFLGALGAFYSKIPVAHVEAGLRTNDRYSPFPEEINRRLTSNLATLHFAPTQNAKEKLLKENIAPEHVFVTGNTVIDALHWSLKKPHKLSDDLEALLTSPKKTILLTTHRRENFGSPHKEVFKAIKALLQDFNDIQVIFPIHPNPNVRKQAYSFFDNEPEVKLIEPLGYLDFINVMQRCHLILTDSGGVQEEAPSLNKPVLILRESTERPEGLTSGCLKLVGTDKNKIIQETKELLQNEDKYNQMAQAQNPYGDGLSAQKILNHSLEYLNKTV